MSRKQSVRKMKAKSTDKLVKDLTKTIIKPLMQTETAFFQELVDTSNDLSKIMQQKAQYEYIVKGLEKTRKKIQEGKEIKPPFLVALIPKILYYNETSKKTVLKMYDEQLDAYKKNVKSLQGQIELRYENYIESSVRNREFMARRFAKAEIKDVAGARHEAVKEEEALFEAEFKDLAKNPELKKKFDKAKKEAIRHNVARKTKSKQKKIDIKAKA